MEISKGQKYQSLEWFIPSLKYVEHLPFKVYIHIICIEAALVKKILDAEPVFNTTPYIACPN